MQQNTVFPSLRACRATRPEAAMRQDMKRGTRALTNRSLSAESGSMGNDETGECVDGLRGKRGHARAFARRFATC